MILLHMLICLSPDIIGTIPRASPIQSYNCKGLKSSYVTIDSDMLSNCDLLFICEHWLTAYEVLAFKNRFNESNRRWVHMKSSINVDEQLIGRPHGGIGFIGNRIPNITYKPLYI